jgi:hypothetical protein
MKIIGLLYFLRSPKMINRLLIAVIIILSLCLGAVLGYAFYTQKTATDTGSTPREMYTETVVEYSYATSELTPTPPKVLEKDIKPVPYYLWLNNSDMVKEALDSGTFRFQVEAGSRVEGEVSLQGYSFSSGARQEFALTNPVPVISDVKDPFGDTIKQSLRRQGDMIDISIQSYPWKFAFIAPVSGEYSLRILTSVSPMTLEYCDAYLKVTIYEE